MAKRDFVHERLIEDPKRKAERAARNRARRITGAAKGMEVDHKDGNPTNNSRSNLRVVAPKANNTGRGGGSKLQKRGK